MMQDSAGAVVGALIGSWLLQYDFHFVCWVGAAIFVLAAGWNAWLLPAYRISTVRIPMKEGMLRVLRDRRFLTYVLTLTGYYMLAVQVMLMMPIVVNEIAGSPAAVKWMYAIEAALSLSLLYPLARWGEKHFRRAAPDGGPVADDAQPAADRSRHQFAGRVHADLLLLSGIDHRRTGARNAERFAGRSARAAAIWALAAWVWRWAARWVIPAAVGCTIPGGR